jgi:hypothetical protein
MVSICTVALLHIYSLCVIIAITRKEVKKMARLNANIDDCTYVELKKLAVEKGTTITAIVANLITEYLCEQKKKQDCTEKQ